MGVILPDGYWGRGMEWKKCPGCAEREAKIAELEAQLRARSATATQRLDRIAELEADSRRLENDLAIAEHRLYSDGYTRTCDIPACNCGDTWGHGGHAHSRLREIGDALGERTQGVNILAAVTALVEADDAAMLAQQARDDACTDCGAPPDQCRCGPVRE